MEREREKDVVKCFWCVKDCLCTDLFSTVGFEMSHPPTLGDQPAVGPPSINDACLKIKVQKMDIICELSISEANKLANMFTLDLVVRPYKP